MTQIRATAGLQWKENLAAFEKYATAVDRLVSLAMSPSGTALDLQTSRMLAKSMLTKVIITIVMLPNLICSCTRQSSPVKANP